MVVLLRISERVSLSIEGEFLYKWKKKSPKFKQNLLFKLMTLAKLSSLTLEDAFVINITVLPLWRDAKNGSAAAQW